MKSIAKAFSTKRECSVQEAVYLLMPELWLRKTFPVVIFANSNLPEKRYKMFRNKADIDELPEDSVDVFKQNMIDRYMDRPNRFFMRGKYAVLDTLCYASFLAHYYVCPNFNFNDSQPTVLSDDDLESNHSLCTYPNAIPLMSSKE